MTCESIEVKLNTGVYYQLEVYLSFVLGELFTVII